MGEPCEVFDSGVGEGAADADRPVALESDDRCRAGGDGAFCAVVDVPKREPHAVLHGCPPFLGQLTVRVSAPVTGQETENEASVPVSADTGLYAVTRTVPS